jgi:polysaccharide export outer membrane protein
VLWGAMLSLATCAGCSAKYEDLKAFVQSHDHGDTAASTYRIDPPDVIAISSPTSNEVDNVYQTVGIDGKVSLKLLGEIKVSRLTPREVASKLEEMLRRYYVDPKVHVRIAGYRSKKIYVMGQVDQRGPMTFTGRDTVLDVLARAKPNFIAWGAQTKIIRPSANPNERHEIIVNVDDIMQKGDLRGNVVLQPGDIIYVPPTPMGWVGLRVREALFPFTPIEEAYRTPTDFATATDRYEDHFADD